MRWILFSFVIFMSASSFAENLCKVAQNPLLKALDVSGDPWVLYWSDEFDVPGALDPLKWKLEVGGHGWGNREDQFYTDRQKNARVEDGKLVIEAHKEEFQNKHYTSARVNSVAKLTYGKVEFRAKMPSGQGTWGAGWLLADKKVYGTIHKWPENGEIDVVESIGHDPDMNHFSLHSHNNSFANGTQITTKFLVPNARQEFHTYSLEWLPESIDLSVDGVSRLHVIRKPGDDWQQWPFDQDMYLIMNLAIGGVWGKEKGPIDDSIFPTRMEFDYVRVYRPSATQSACLVPDRPLPEKTTAP